MLVPGRPMSLGDGLEQVSHRLGLLRIGRGVLLAAEAVSGAVWLAAEQDGAVPAEDIR